MKRCMQVSTGLVAQFLREHPEDLKKIDPNYSGTAADAIKELESSQEEVVPCGRHRCDETGRCTGEPVEGART